jgi:hypothetical protein
MADAILKRCPVCRTSKPLDAFYKAGTAAYCIPCEKEYKREHYRKNAEHYKARTVAWSRANKERKSEADRAYREANRERCAERAKAYQRAHKQDHLRLSNESRQRNLHTYRAREAAYRERTRAICNERIKEWKRRNPDAIVFYAGKRRAAELQALPAWADLDAISVVYKRAQEMGSGYHVDHVVPLVSQFVCGLHCEANLQILTAKENARKNNRHWPDMW